MKAIVTVIDDNGKVICEDKVLSPYHESISLNLNQPPIKVTRFNFVVRQLGDIEWRSELYCNTESETEE